MSLRRTPSMGSAMSQMSSFSQRQTQPPPPPRSADCLSCNVCSKPLSGSAYVLACDCLLCEDCVYSHFEHHNTCPICDKLLRDEDIMQTEVTEKLHNANPNEDLKQLFKKIFVKGQQSRGGSYVQFLDACQAAYQAQQRAGKLTRFLYKQFLHTSHGTFASAGRLQQELNALKDSYTQLRQQSLGDRATYEQETQQLNQRLQTLERQLESATAHNNLLTRQVQQLGGGIEPQGMVGGGSQRSSASAMPNSLTHRQGDIPEFVGGPTMERPKGPQPTPIVNMPSFSSNGTSAAGYNFTRNRHLPLPPKRQNYSFAGSHQSKGDSSFGSRKGPIKRMQQQKHRPRSYTFAKPPGFIGTGIAR